MRTKRVERRYQGREITTTIQAPTLTSINTMLKGMRAYAKSHGLESVKVLEKGRDPDGGFRVIFVAHNWNPLKWFKEKWEVRAKRTPKEKVTKEAEGEGKRMEREVAESLVAQERAEEQAREEKEKAKREKDEAKEAKAKRKAEAVEAKESKAKAVVEKAETEAEAEREAERERKIAKWGERRKVPGKVMGKALEPVKKGVAASMAEVSEAREKALEGISVGLAGVLEKPPVPAEAEKIEMYDKISWWAGVARENGEVKDRWWVLSYPYKTRDDAELVVGDRPEGTKEVASIGDAVKAVQELIGSSGVGLFVELQEISGNGVGIDQLAKPTATIRRLARKPARKLSIHRDLPSLKAPSLKEVLGV